MQALRKVTVSAAEVAERTRHLHVVRTPGPDVQVDTLADNTALALDQWQRLLDAGLPTVRPIALTDRQVDDLVAFMLALTDPCVKDAACLAPWMPAPADNDPDGLRLEIKLASAD